RRDIPSRSRCPPALLLRELSWSTRCGHSTGGPGARASSAAPPPRCLTRCSPASLHSSLEGTAGLTTPPGPGVVSLLPAAGLHLTGELLHRARPLGIRDVIAVAGVLAIDHGQRALPEQLAALGPDARAPHRLPLGLEVGRLPAGELLDLLRDAHAAPVVAAHRAEVGVDLQVLVVQRAGRLAVEGELELPGPVERGAGPREIVVPVAGPRDATRDVARVGSDAVGEAAGAEAVSQGVGDVVLAHDRADLVEQLVHGVLAAVVEHPLGEQRAAARHDPGHARGDQRQVLAQHAGVDREVVDALPRLA